MVNINTYHIWCEVSVYGARRQVCLVQFCDGGSDRGRWVVQSYMEAAPELCWTTISNTTTPRATWQRNNLSAKAVDTRAGWTVAWWSLCWLGLGVRAHPGPASSWQSRGASRSLGAKGRCVQPGCFQARSARCRVSAWLYQTQKVPILQIETHLTSYQSGVWFIIVLSELITNSEMEPSLKSWIVCFLNTSDKSPVSQCRESDG